MFLHCLCWCFQLWQVEPELASSKPFLPLPSRSALNLTFPQTVHITIFDLRNCPQTAQSLALGNRPWVGSQLLSTLVWMQVWRALMQLRMCRWTISNIYILNYPFSFNSHQFSLWKLFHYAWSNKCLSLSSSVHMCPNDMQCGTLSKVSLSL